MGDGLGHVALTGVGLGLLTKTSPVWGAVLVAVAGAAAVELIRERARPAGTWRWRCSSTAGWPAGRC